jgi:oligosaccharide repeat unit polymerase
LVPERRRWAGGLAFDGIRLVQTLVLALTVLAGVVLLQSRVLPSILWLSAASLALFGWHLWSWARVSGTLANPYGFFLVSVTLFNSGQTILELFGLNANKMLDGSFDERTLVRAAYLVLLALASLHFGALLAFSQRSPAPHRTRDLAATNQAVRRIGTVLIAVSALPVAVTMLDALRTAQAGGYGAMYGRDAKTGFDGYLQFLAALLVPGAHYALAGAARHRKTAAVATISLFAYCVALLFVGYRAISVMPLVTFAWLWHHTVRPIKSRAAISFAIVAIVMLFSVVPAVRLRTGSDRTSLDQWTQTVKGAGNPIVAVVSEMGGTLAVVAYTIELVPSERPFDLGMGYVYAATTVVPNLSRRLHPAIVYGSYTDWLIRRVNPWAALHGGSLGFSCIAESYANFGWLGTIPFMLVLGYGIVRFQRWALSTDDPAVLAALATFTSFLLFFARAESNTLVRPLVWFAAVPIVLVRLMAKSEPDRRLTQGRH